MSRTFSQLVFCLCASLAVSSAFSAESDAETVATVFAKAATYAYLNDFVHSPVVDEFSDQELTVLSTYLEQLDLIVRDALSQTNGVGGALLSGHFKLKGNFKRLRWHLLKPGRAYGWEGTNSSDEEWFLSDHQYVYHSVYAASIENMMGAPLRDIIVLDENERLMIQSLAKSNGHENQYWAIWLGGKLGVL